MDEKIIDLMSRRRKELSEASREDSIARSIEAGILTIEEQTIEFEERSLLEERLKIRLPKTFTVMPAEIACLKYPAERRPAIIFTDETTTINVLLNLTKTLLQEQEVEEFKNYMLQTVQKMQPSAQHYENGLKEIHGQNIGYFDFSVPAIDMNIYNLIFVAAMDGKALISSINCPEEEMESWGPIAKGIMNSLIINAAPAEDAGRHDFSHYNFRKGFYAIYNNKEYRLYKLEDGRYRLVSNDAQDAAAGFEPKDGVWKKTVSQREITAAYEVNTTLIYQGTEFELGEDRGDKVLLVKNDCNNDLARSLQLEMIAPREYEKWVAKKEIADVLEERRVVAGFPMPG